MTPIPKERPITEHRGDGLDLFVAQGIDALAQRRAAGTRGIPAVERERVGTHALTVAMPEAEGAPGIARARAAL